jgi:3D (Asp-Asp-Asp) domain-containing protein
VSARFLGVILAVAMCCTPLAARARHRHTRYRVRATAFCLHGTTAAGTRSHTGTAAADPAFLPLGTRVRVSEAKGYSGTYLITDTGSRIKGRHIDLRLPTPSAARRFGKRMVWIQVLHWGDGEVTAREDARARPPARQRR